MSALDRYKAYITTCAARGVLSCSYEAFAADEARACPACEDGIPASVQAGVLVVPGQGGREGGHLVQAQSLETRMEPGSAAGLMVGTDIGALARIAEKLRRAGAKLPMTLTAEIATREGMIASGLSIALCLVEIEIENQVAGQAATPTTQAELPAAAANMQRQQDPVRASNGTQGDVRKLLVVGGRQFSAQALLDLQHDAARYRWLRDKADGMLGVAAPMVASLDETGRVTTLLDEDDLDAAVDMAMAAPVEKRQRKTKRVGTNK